MSATRRDRIRMVRQRLEGVVFKTRRDANVVRDLIFAYEAALDELESPPPDPWTDWLDRLRAAGLTDAQMDKVLAMIEALALIHAPVPSEDVAPVA